ncbi:MAG: Verru_Chthon cassette protein B [Verrucomicrobiales bacterium]|nr:Verru_Chthon cassette protein B [Verrucomicrobiales bacterium]
MTPAEEAPRSTYAFSLIEVAIALAIFSSGILLLFSMLPGSLFTMKEASSRSIERRIARNLVNDLMLNEWERLHQFDSRQLGSRHFDSQGIELSEYGMNAIFTARIKIHSRDVNIDPDRTLEEIDISDSGDYSLPDDTYLGKSTSQHSRRITVEITDVPLETFDFDDPENAKRFRSFSTVVANMKDTDSLNKQFQ